MLQKKSVKGKSSKTSSNISSCKKNGVSLSAGSGSSANSKDWENWNVLHGNAKVVEDDVIDVGESIGVPCNNSFQVLSRGPAGGGLVREKEMRKVRVV